MIMEAHLTEKERELIAVGASVAAGCVPCTQYHMKAVRGTEASTEEIIRAVETALCVRAGARSVMARTAYEALGLPAPGEPSCCTLATDRLTRLVAIAAAVAANCPPIFESQSEAGSAAGVDDRDVRIAVALARMIRAKATEKMDQAAEQTTAGAPGQSQCGCGCAS